MDVENCPRCDKPLKNSRCREHGTVGFGVCVACDARYVTMSESTPDGKCRLPDWHNHQCEPPEPREDCGYRAIDCGKTLHDKMKDAKLMNYMD